MLIDCPGCKAKLCGVVAGGLDVMPRAKDAADWQEGITDPGRTSWPARVTLLQCPNCKEAIVTRQLQSLSPNEWVPPYRVWPAPQQALDWSIPTAIRDSLEEARRSLSAGIYGASVPMTGRAIEAVARHFNNGPDKEKLSLGRGLDELHASKIIDDRLLSWGKEVQEHRNLAAHATGRTFTRQEAQDLLDFAGAMCEYVFVLPAKYESFRKRKSRRKKAASRVGA